MGFRLPVVADLRLVAKTSRFSEYVLQFPKETMPTQSCIIPGAVIISLTRESNIGENIII